MLKLPSYQQLSKEQDAINNLPLTGSYLVVGPPGTGKTVMAIYRASMLKRMHKTSTFIVFNRTLRQYLDQAIELTGLDTSATTFHKWFYSWYPRNFHRKAPEIEHYVFDWMEIYRNIASSEKPFEKYDHLIIDEGQDFPKEFYFVARQLFKDLTVFADENQRITDQNSTIKEIQIYLGVKEIYHLTRNYRNTLPVAEFARTFYAGLSSGMAELPTKKGPRPRLVSAPDLNSQVEFIARYERNNPDRDIAVFVPTNRQQNEFWSLLKKCGTRNPVQLYIGSNKYRKKLDFHQCGIKVLAYASAKGLEFDAVFLPELEKRLSNPDSDLEKMRFYVMTSRTRKDLFLLFCGNEIPTFLQHVPEHLFELESIDK